MTVTLFWPFGSRSPPCLGSAVAGMDPATPSLDHYSSRVLPPSARVDPKQPLRETNPVRLWHFWKYGVLAISKTVEVSLAVVAHHTLGPRRPSWSIEETILTAMMRNAAQHSHLVNIATVRAIMNISGLVPLPSDALVTPVTFRVRRRRLPGILEGFDRKETGSRELSGEWVVSKKTWQRLQNDWKASRSSNPSHKPPPAQMEQVIMYLHGGAYYLSSAAAQRLISIPLSKYADARVFALDYRLAPETKFPGPLHDAVSCYLRLVEDLRIPASNIILAGDSAGGGLTLALLFYLRDHSYPLPAGAILMSPWVDLSMSCSSWDTNAAYDVTPVPEQSDSMNPVALYLGVDQMHEYITHAYASPLFGEFKGLPPLLIQAGNAEVLRDEITLLAHKATLAGVNVKYELYEDCVHVFQTYPFVKASAQAFLSIKDFTSILPRIQRTSPRVLDGRTESHLGDEIENELVTVVRGDGVQTASGRQQLQRELEDDSEEQTDSESDAEPSRSAGLQSWGRTEAWSSPLSDSDDRGEDSDADSVQTPPELPRRRRRADTLPSHSPGLRRIRSAMSIIIPSPNHHSQSHQPLRRTTSNRSRAFTPRKSDLRTNPPTPHLRRNSISHPDISMLVDQMQWPNTRTNPSYKSRPT